MNHLIKTETVDLNTLIKNVSLNENTESKMIEILKTEFTEEELRWYV